MLEQLARREGELGERDERLRGGVREQLERAGYEREEGFDFFEVGDDGAGADEGGGCGGEGAGLVREVRC